MLMKFQCSDWPFAVWLQRIHCLVNMLMNCAGKKDNENNYNHNVKKKTVFCP